MDQCEMLAEYAEFISISRQYASEEKNVQEAMNAAVEYCIDHDILSGFLRQNRAEVLGMLLEEFDVEKYERTLRSEGREDGFREGRTDAIRKMLLKGMSVQQVADILEIPVESVEQIKKD
jgi:predicted transposase/invertase (TIGR01784 family)